MRKRAENTEHRPRAIFRDKKVLVVGLKRSGIGAANLLANLGAKVTVTDRKPRELLNGYIERLNSSIEVIAGSHPEHIFQEADLIVISPGVPLNIPPLLKAKAMGVSIIGELELAYQIIKSGVRSQRSDFIAITGTNGKSTTTTLIDLMLKRSGFKVLTGGNIGNALTEEISNLKSQVFSLNFIVTEVSSFQLEAIDRFKPWISAILNITPDHLDRYRSMQEYIDAKARIFENQSDDDYIILNADDPLMMQLKSERLKGKGPMVLYFSREKEVEGIYLKNGVLYCNLPHLSLMPLPIISQHDIRIKGMHNLENAMVASLITVLCGGALDAIMDILKSFGGLEHRLEFVCEINGVSFINDSKGTNTGAVMKSLEGLERVILIMGGLDKGEDFSVLRDIVSKKVKLLILIGQAREKIKDALSGIVETLMVDSLEDAVNASLSISSKGDTVLLSPGCASFDMFNNFEERGRRFKEILRTIKLQKDN